LKDELTEESRCQRLRTLFGLILIVPSIAAILRSWPRATPLEAAACLLAIVATWSHPAAGAEHATLMEFLDESPAAVGETFEEVPSLAPSPLEDDRSLQVPLEPRSSPLSDASIIPEDESYGAPYGVGPEDRPDYMPPNRPISWISGPYLRYGVDFVIGEGVLEGGQKLGWGINGGFRQALAPGLASGRIFFDLGGGYLSAVGNTHRILPGDQVTAAGARTPIADAFSVNLTEVRRASVHTALGWYWGDVVDQRGDDPRLRFATRFGGRYGSVRGDFLEERIKDPAVGTTLESTYLNTDTFGGLLVGTEAILLNRSFSTCTVLWTADVEFANDWIEFGGFDSGSLGTASLMTGFMLSR
jgi:hypothetical protein